LQFDIRRLNSSAQLSVCASLMMQSNPWDKLYFSQQQLESDLVRPDLRVDAAVGSDGTILGFLASMANGIGFEPMIEYLCVDSRFRGQGIGTRLIQYFEKALFPEADNLYLFVSDINPDAQRLYVKLGYLQAGAFPNFNLDKQTEFLHRKSRRPRQAASMAEQRSAAGG
jgi:ribosomal protein S18 acetylase RimI-like enzyme